MDDRMQRALDGELPADGLTPQERVELQQYRAVLGTALEPISRLAPIDVTADVMRRLPAPRLAHRPLAAALDWLWSPRAVKVRPAVALAGALAVAAVISLSILQPATPATLAAVPARVLVQFRLGDADAREVALVGDFNGWRPEQRLHQVAAGVWSVDVALEPGVYNYVFVVDGTSMRLDPLAPRVTDGFGGASSRVAVLAPETSS
ncbi:MAG TPA: glycogen-binding domain-containing protein [Gemmatimonadales bacterium]|nr:glycogen-binding domain-containing protein [Gemmatimonadales bacterium]